MSISYTSQQSLADLNSAFEPIVKRMGFLPNSLQIMARRPAIVTAFVALVNAVFESGDLPRTLKSLVALVASGAAGCRYCQAHTSQTARREGADMKKIEKIWEFEQSDLFNDSERAALRFARDAALQPNAVTEKSFDELAKHFSEDEIVDLLAVVCVFGFLNRWNDSLGTKLEDVPMEFARNTLGPSGWVAGKHSD